jgi:hypothetical protein
MKIGDTVIVPKLTQRGSWWVTIFRILDCGKYLRVGTEKPGAFGKPRWVGASSAVLPKEHRKALRDEKTNIRANTQNT